MFAGLLRSLTGFELMVAGALTAGGGGIGGRPRSCVRVRAIFLCGGVMAAIVAYKADHSAAETEDAVRRWYDKYDDELAAAIQANQDIKTLRDANVSNGYELCQQGRDYEKCAKRQRAEQGGARLDQSQIESNNQLMVRIQHSFMKIRNGLNQNGLQYEWFKVRTTNNIDRF